jgi:hypothetical protein
MKPAKTKINLVCMQQPDIAPVKVGELTFPMILDLDVVNNSGDTVNTVLCAVLYKLVE